jgi:hypothetical protein
LNVGFIRCADDISGLDNHAPGLYGRLMPDLEAFSLTTFAASAVVSLISSGMAVHYLQSRREDAKVNNERVEQLYLAIQRWSTGISDQLTQHIDCLMGRQSIDDANLIEERDHPKRHEHAERMNLLIGVYFRNIKKDLDAVYGHYIDAVNVWTEHTGEDQYKHGDVAQLRDQLIDANNRFHAEVALLMERVVKLLK